MSPFGMNKLPEKSLHPARDGALSFSINHWLRISPDRVASLVPGKFEKMIANKLGKLIANDGKNYTALAPGRKTPGMGG